MAKKKVVRRKFKVDDRVRIVGSFYEGNKIYLNRIGIITADDETNKARYRVCFGPGVIGWFTGKDLDSIGN